MVSGILERWVWRRHDEVFKAGDAFKKMFLISGGAYSLELFLREAG